MTQINLYVIKKDDSIVNFKDYKIKNAIRKSAERVMVKLTKEEENQVVLNVKELMKKDNKTVVPVETLHKYVEISLENVKPVVARSYIEYRNYKKDFVNMIDEAYRRSQKIMFLGDKENSNTDSALVATKRVLSYNEINRLFYKKFFLNQAEINAIEDGYIYIHDMSSRRDTYNCCLFDVFTLFDKGFEMGNMWYNEPTNIDKALDVLGDIISVVAGQQYGGLTIPEVDRLLSKYVEKSFNAFYKEMKEEADDFYGVDIETNSKLKERIKKKALKKTRIQLEDGIQGIEYKANSVGSSRGDYPFITFSFGEDTNNPYSVMVAEAILKVRKKGQGQKGKKKCVLFPKLVFLYVDWKHGEKMPFEYLYDKAIECSAVCMYPDYLSLTGEQGYVSEIYKKYGKIVSPMGCRAFLSPWFERGGMKPADESDTPVYIGRANLGAISLNLIMIYQKAKEENKDFYEVLDYYLEMIRKLHIRTYDYIADMKASINPTGFCEGGFYGGNLGLHDRIEPVIKTWTLSFGITALNELQEIHNHKSLVEDNSFAKEVLTYINKKVDEFKEKDGKLYAIYGTPAESLCGKQIQQFRKKYGIIKGVSDREYVSNSFHCHVTENITGMEKQDKENELYHLCKGGCITYCKYPMGYNHNAIKTLVRRGMKYGMYHGVNLSLSFCNNCGTQYTSKIGDECLVCGSTDITGIERMNGYLSLSKIKGDTRLNEAKMKEIEDRISM